MKSLCKRCVKYYSSSTLFFDDLVKEIKGAKKSVFLESYKVDGVVGARIKEVLIEKLKEGVEVKLLFDYWGSSVGKSFFKEIELLGGEVRFFRVFKVTSNWFSYNNSRDHRKIAIVDNVCFVGSANLAINSKGWREFIIRIKDVSFSDTMRLVFLDNFKIHSLFFHSKKKHVKKLSCKGLDIIRDVPSFRYQKIRNKRLHLIRNAKRSVVVETPYFVPDTKTLIALIRAADRGVHIKLIIPKKSDVRIVDFLAQSLFGELYRRGVEIFFFSPGFTHSKVLLVDDEVFSFGSSNFDYRSFKYQYEISFFGSDRVIMNYVKTHLEFSLKSCESFDFKKWSRRHWFVRLIEIIVEPFRELF